MEYPPDLHERDDDYPLSPEVMIFDPEITGEKQHNLCAQYFGSACSYSRKLICSFFPKKHYVLLGQLLRIYLDRGIKLFKVNRVIPFKSSPYAASDIGNNTAKRQQFKHDDVKAFYKLMNNAPYGKTIENVTRRTDIRLRNDMEKAWRLAEKPHCVDFRVFDGQVAPLIELIEAAAAKEQQQEVALERIKMRRSITLLRSRSPMASSCLSTASKKCM